MYMCAGNYPIFFCAALMFRLLQLSYCYQMSFVTISPSKTVLNKKITRHYQILSAAVHFTLFCIFFLFHCDVHNLSDSSEGDLKDLSSDYS